MNSADGARLSPLYTDQRRRKTKWLLKIRLARGGTKKRPHYNIVIADSRMPARRPLHREDRLLQSAAAQGSCRPREARPRQGQGMDDEGRHRVRPRPSLPRQCGPCEAAGAEQSEKAKPKKKAQERRPPMRLPAPRLQRRRPKTPRRRSRHGGEIPRRAACRRHRRAGAEGRGEGENLHRRARGACALWRLHAKDGRRFTVTAGARHARPAKPF